MLTMKQKWYRWRRKQAIRNAVRLGQRLRSLETDRAYAANADSHDVDYIDGVIRRTQEKKDKHLRYLSRTPPV